MSIEQLKKMCDQLAAARKLLAEHKSRLGLCDLRGHQESISIRVGNIGSIDLTYMDQCYMQRQIRGREMIMLGVKKVLGAMVDEQAARVAKLEQAISDARVTV